MHLVILVQYLYPTDSSSTSTKESRSLQSLDLCFLTADNYSGLAVAVHILGGVKFVSLLFPTCIKAMTTGHVISVRDLFCCVASQRRHASCLSVVSSSTPGMLASALVLRLKVVGRTGDAEPQQHRVGPHRCQSPSGD